MKMCQPHWDKLREAICARGLEQFIAHDGNEVIRRMTSQAQEAAATFEPLMGAQNAILWHAIQARGTALMDLNEDGSERCPICFTRDTCNCGAPDCAERYEQWIGHAADEALTEAKRRGLVADA